MNKLLTAGKYLPLAITLAAAFVADSAYAQTASSAPQTYSAASDGGYSAYAQAPAIIQHMAVQSPRRPNLRPLEGTSLFRICERQDTLCSTLAY